MDSKEPNRRYAPVFPELQGMRFETSSAHSGFDRSHECQPFLRRFCPSVAITVSISITITITISVSITIPVTITIPVSITISLPAPIPVTIPAPIAQLAESAEFTEHTEFTKLAEFAELAESAELAEFAEQLEAISAKEAERGCATVVVREIGAAAGCGESELGYPRVVSFVLFALFAGRLAESLHPCDFLRAGRHSPERK